MSTLDDGYKTNTELVNEVEDDVVYIPPSSDLVTRVDDADIVPIPNADLTERINDTLTVSGDDNIITTTSDNFVTSGKIAGEDTVDFGLSSDMSLGGLGVNIDDLPGDERPISRENIPVD